MAITLRQQEDAEVSPPNNPSRVALYVDPNGNPKTKDSAGSISNLVTVDGSPLDLNEQVSAPGAEADKGKLYAKEVNGVTELFYRDDSGNGGNEIQITSNGLTVGSNINWRGGTPGTTYDNANPASAGLVAVGDTVMVYSEGGTEVSVTFPAADAASAGKDITIINTIDKEDGEDNGTVRIIPASGDNFGSWPDDQQLEYDADSSDGMIGATFRSDGNGTWWLIGDGQMTTGVFGEYP